MRMQTLIPRHLMLLTFRMLDICPTDKSFLDLSKVRVGTFGNVIEWKEMYTIFLVFCQSDALPSRVKCLKISFEDALHSGNKVNVEKTPESVLVISIRDVRHS